MPTSRNGRPLDRILLAAQGLRICSTIVLAGARTTMLASSLVMVASSLVTSTLFAQSGLSQPGLSQANPQAKSEQSPRSPAPLAGGVYPVYPLEQVHRGLHAVAYTVFEGTQPEAMEVEILGLLHNALGPGKDLILARLEGAKPEYTGVVAGMSGSPVYVDGKLLGALSYRIGQFSKEPIAGITPIAQMLEVRDVLRVSDDNPRPPPLVSGRDQQPSATPVSASPTIEPIETPLVLSGFSPGAVELWQEKFSGSGLTAIAGIGGSSQTSAAPPAKVLGDIPDTAPVVPGSAVSAILVRGDVQIAATCTVTYIDSKQLLACGHPITQYGAVSFPMTKAEVLATLASPLNAFKIINTTETIGSFTDDRLSAIRGVFGGQARMIPVSVTVSSDAVSGAAKPRTLKPRTLNMEVVNQPQITPSAVLVSFYQALMEDNGDGADTTYHVKGTIQLEGYAPITTDSWVAPTDAQPASLLAAMQVGDRFTKLYSNATRLNRITGIQFTVDAIDERRQLQIESAHIGNLNVHAGEQVTIEASLRPYRGELRNIRIPVKLPTTLPSGPIRMLVSDGPTLDRISQPNRQSSRPLDINATIAQMESLHTNDSIYVTLLRPEAQAAVDGRTLSSVPLSMANVLDPLRNAQELTLSGESLTPVTSVAVNAALTGQQVIALHVE